MPSGTKQRGPTERRGVLTRCGAMFPFSHELEAFAINVRLVAEFRD
jgi:hypothetical protein